MGWLYVGAALLEAALTLAGPWAIPLDRLVTSDYLYMILISAYLAAGIAVLALRGRAARLLWPSEVLFVVTLVFFLFTYIYALNANMDYVQRFMASGGKVRLALDTRTERLAAAVRYLPLLACALASYLMAGKATPAGQEVRRWALPLTLASVALSVLSFPSFANLEGFGFLAFVALVPLFLVLERTSLWAGWLFTIGYGVLEGMLVSFWVGTFSLVTLQLVALFLMLAHALFFLPALWLCRRLARLRFLALALAWVLFEYLRSIGYWGYPWGLWGTAPYRFLTLTQIASLAGVWGVSFAVLLLNSGLASALAGVLRREGTTRRLSGPLTALAVFAGCLAFGLVSRALLAREPAARTVRVALVQQNSDPRKDEYADTFATLRRLTDRTMAAEPELVVWSETAFVPNIRRWSREDPENHPLARLVHAFLDYQKSLGVWLLTGNDDYELSVGEAGEEIRKDYNAAVLFDPRGTRVETYHKLHLVPFTEYFPFEEELPGLYRWLESFDVYLWEPGRERTVFRHPRFAFATPICFEDSFPDDVRRFVLAGAQAIVNISNDYWSLTEAEAKQHAVNASFRAIENRRPLLRATASGLTCYVDADGGFLAEAPYYEPSVLVLDILFRPERTTLYNRAGDWLPWGAAGVLAALAFLSAFKRLRAKL